jgi:hypothetical protein
MAVHLRTIKTTFAQTNRFILSILNDFLLRVYINPSSFQIRRSLSFFLWCILSSVISEHADQSKVVVWTRVHGEGAASQFHNIVLFVEVPMEYRRDVQDDANKCWAHRRHIAFIFNCSCKVHCSGLNRVHAW